MKRFSLCFCVIFSLLAFGFTSCSDDDPIDNPGTENEGSGNGNITSSISEVKALITDKVWEFSGESPIQSLKLNSDDNYTLIQKDEKKFEGKYEIKEIEAIAKAYSTFAETSKNGRMLNLVLQGFDTLKLSAASADSIKLVYKDVTYNSAQSVPVIETINAFFSFSDSLYNNHQQQYLLLLDETKVIDTIALVNRNAVILSWNEAAKTLYLAEDDDQLPTIVQAVNIETKEVKNIAEIPAYGYDLTLSSDGKYAYYVAESSDSTNTYSDSTKISTNIIQYDIATKTTKKISIASSDVELKTLSPDSKTLLYEAKDALKSTRTDSIPSDTTIIVPEEDVWSLFSLDIASGEKALIIENSSAYDFEYIKVSPDNSKIAMSSYQKLFVSDKDGKNMNEVAKGTELILGGWSYNSTSVYFFDGVTSVKYTKYIVAEKKTEEILKGISISTSDLFPISIMVEVKK